MLSREAWFIDLQINVVEKLKINFVSQFDIIQILIIEALSLFNYGKSIEMHKKHYSHNLTLKSK